MGLTEQNDSAGGFFIRLLVLIVLGCLAWVIITHEYQPASKKEIESTAWELVGNIKPCKLYRKIEQSDTLYWSICIDDDKNVSSALTK